MALQLPMPSLEDAQMRLVVSFHETMRSYNEELMANYRNEDEITSRYIQEIIALLVQAVGNVSDPEPYMDALLLVKCFAATALLPSKRSAQIPIFLDWVQTVQNDSSQYTLKSFEARLTEKGGALDEEIWDFVVPFVLTGRLSEANEILQNSSIANDSDVLTLCALLSSYPIEASKYVMFGQWRSDALAFRDNLREEDKNTRKNEYASGIRRTAEILTGNTNLILTQSENWVSAVSGLFLFYGPSAEELPSHFRLAAASHAVNLIPTWEEGSKLLFEDKIVAALGCLQLLDINSAVAISEFCNGRGLFAGYASVEGKVGGGVREELDLSYARMCLAEPALVDIGAEVLVNLGSITAKESALSYLPQLVRRSSEYADIAIEAAEQLGLNNLVLDLHRIAAEADLEDHKYVSAIKFFYKAEDYSNVRETSWKLFKEMLLTKQLTADEETALILENTTNLAAVDMDLTVKDHLAPSAVLLALIEAIAVEDIEKILENLHGLLTFPDPPLEYYPLLVALVSGVSGSVLQLKNMTLLMRALRLWDTASEPTKQSSYNLIAEASKQPVWHPQLSPEQDPKLLVWHLRRQLAKEVCL